MDFYRKNLDCISLRERREGREEGMKKGREEGLKEGLEQGKTEVAEKMLKAGLDLDSIAQFTGLNPERIKQLGQQN